MKQVFYILLTGALLGLTSAGCHRGQAQDGLKTTTDSVVKKTAWGNYKIVFDVPESDNRWLENAVIEYASETLGGTYAADASHVREMLEAYGDSIAREYDGIGKELMEVHTPGDTIKMEFEARITKRCEAPGWVTYDAVCYAYSGGAHGMTQADGATFRKTDGRRIGWESFKPFDTEGFRELMTDGLKKYFEVGTDEELSEHLLIDLKTGLLPPPETNPVFGKDGVTFTYQQYEIAAYAYGMPSVTVPYAAIRPYLSATAASLLND